MNNYLPIHELAVILEAYLFATPDPLSADELHELVSSCATSFSLPRHAIEEALLNLQKRYVRDDCAFELHHTAGGYCLKTKPIFAKYIEQLGEKKGRTTLSSQALEVLSIIALKQPITRLEIDDIRGIESSHLVQQLLERELIEVKGKKEAIGRPTLFGTTKTFLEVFNLQSLEEISSIAKGNQLPIS